MLNYTANRKLLDQGQFEVVMSSGQTYRVRHPKVAVVNRMGLVIAYPEDDTVNICPFLHRSAIPTLPLVQTS